MTNRTFVSDLKDLPSSAHYAVLVQETRYESGYDHYASSVAVPYVTYIAFDNEQALTEFLKQETESRNRKDIRVLYVKPMTVETQISVRVANAG